VAEGLGLAEGDGLATMDVEVVGDGDGELWDMNGM
jgi:hypothetical protein